MIRAIALECKILDAKWGEDVGLEEIAGQESEWWDGLSEDSKIRMAIGMAWEDWYVSQLEEVAYHPGELFLDGIFMTHDGESISFVYHNAAELAVHEIKTTSKSTRTVGNLQSQWMWLAQLKGYCKALNTRIGYLHVLFLCGDYKYPITPQLGPTKGESTIYRVEFTQAEIDDNWELMTEYVRHRRAMERGEDAGLEGGV